jgi:hypothetical protein
MRNGINLTHAAIVMRVPTRPIKIERTVRSPCLDSCWLDTGELVEYRIQSNPPQISAVTSCRSKIGKTVYVSEANENLSSQPKVLSSREGLLWGERTVAELEIWKSGK